MCWPRRWASATMGFARTPARRSNLLGQFVPKVAAVEAFTLFGLRTNGGKSCQEGIDASADAEGLRVRQITTM